MRFTPPVNINHDTNPPPRQLRSRPIDLNKNLPIIHSIEDLNKFSTEDHNLRIDPTNLGFKSDNSFNVEELKEKYQQKRKNIVIPPVTIQESKLDVYNRTFTNHDHYIRHECKKEYVSGIIIDDGSIIHFDILQEDDLFLKTLQKQMVFNNHSKSVLSEINFCKLIDAFEKSSGKWGEGQGEINFDEALKIKKDLCIDVPSHIVKEVHNHWKQRRQAVSRPLERSFWQPTKLHDTSPFATFRPRVSDKMTLRRPKRNKFETIQKLEKFLEFCRKVEKLIKKIKQRDERKLALLELNELLFEQMSHELFDPTYKVPHWEFLKEKKFTKTSKKSKKEKDKPTIFNIDKSDPRYLQSITSSHHTQALPGGHITTSASPSSSNLHLRIIRRRGRGGRIWVDRLRAYNKPVPYYQDLEYFSNNLSSPLTNDNNNKSTTTKDLPEIGSNLTSFDLYKISDQYSDQLTRDRILDTLLSFDDDSTLKDNRIMYNPSGISEVGESTYKSAHGSSTNLATFYSNLNSNGPNSNPAFNTNISNNERPAQEDWESLQSFRAWLRYSLAAPQSIYNEHRANTSRSVVISVKPEALATK